MNRRTVILATLAVLALGLFWLLQVLAGPDVGPEATGTPDSAKHNDELTGQRAGSAPEDPTRVITPDKSAPAPLAARPTGTVVVHVLWPDHQAARHITVALFTTEPVYFAADRQPTGEVGRARFTDVPVGKVRVTTDHGGGKTCTVETGKTTEVLLQLTGIAIRGIVVDGDDKPVNNAGIWLTSGRRDWLGGRVVTQTDYKGNFAITSVPANQSLGALAAGFAPSELYDLDEADTAKTPVEVRLVVKEPGGAVAGTITSPSGKPIRDADVCIGKQPGRFQPRHGTSSFVEAWTPLAATTDKYGRFEFAAVPAGTHPFAVRSRGLPIHKGEVEVAAAGTRRLDLTLSAGVLVHGVVQDKAGQAIANATVRAYDVAIDETFIQSGQFDYESVFGFPFTSADAAGRYRLPGVAPGTIHLYASHPGRIFRGKSKPRAKQVLSGESGAEIEWHPVIDAGLTIPGLVTYQDGAPMKNTFVNARQDGSEFRQVLITDHEGRFRFVNMPEARFTVDVQNPFDAPRGHPRIERKQIWPGSGEIHLVATFDSPKPGVSGSVRGMIHDAANRHTRGGLLTVSLRTENSSRTAAANAEGEFVFERVPPDRYRITAASGNKVIYAGGWFELTAAQNYDTGTLITEPGGDLQIKFTRRKGTEGIEPRVFAKHVATGESREILPGRANEFVEYNLNAGAYEVRTSSAELASTTAPVEVVPGQRAAVELVFRRGVRRYFEITFLPRPTPAEMTISVHDAEDRRIYRRSSTLSDSTENPQYVGVQLPLGRGKVRVQTSGGFVGERTYEVKEVKGRAPFIPVTMQPKK